MTVKELNPQDRRSHAPSRPQNEWVTTLTKSPGFSPMFMRETSVRCSYQGYLCQWLFQDLTGSGRLLALTCPLASSRV